jgi:hypothetical protein
MRDHYRHTKIIATVGPATESEERLSQLISAGVDVLRLNMAHATREWVLELVARVRRVSSELSRQVAVMMDVKGPEIRAGPVDETIVLEVGDELELFTDSPTPGARAVSVNYPGLPNDVQVGATMLLDSGLMRFEITSKDSCPRRDSSRLARDVGDDSLARGAAPGAASRPLVTLLARTLLDDTVAATRAEHTAFGAFAVATIVDSVVALLLSVLHDAIATPGSENATRRTLAVATVIDTIVAFLTLPALALSVSAAGRQRAVGVAAAVLAGVQVGP